MTTEAWVINASPLIRDWDKQRIIDLFAVIDWLLQLPEALERKLWVSIQELERNANMPYVTSVQRIGRQEGRREGEAAMLLLLIENKFGPPSEAVRERIENADAEMLLRWSARVLTAERVEEVFSSD